MISVSKWISELENPVPFTPGAELWNDPHISGEMLKAHLSPDTDAASYKPNTIEAICSHLPSAMHLNKGASIVDLGCGPGLYAKGLSSQGYSITGIDRSENSIRYAKKLNAGMPAEFINASYLEPFGENFFDAAVMISKDYGVLPPAQRQILLNNIHAALKPGGFFALDVHSMSDFLRLQKKASLHWEAEKAGFWRPHPYLAVSKCIFYPDISVSCDLHGVLDEEMTVYRIWQTYYTQESITNELEVGGFNVLAVWGSLKGGPLQPESPLIAVLCQKT